MPHFELVEGTAKKFWEITVKGSSTHVRYGRIGTDGREQTKDYSSAAEAEQAAAKLIAAKQRKGYVERGAGEAGTPPAGLGLTAAAERKLIAKLEKADEPSGYLKAIQKAVPGQDPLQVMVDLAGRGKLPPEDCLFEHLEEVSAETDPEALAAIVGGLAEVHDDYLVLPGVAREVLDCLLPSVEKHPSFWDPDREEIPASLKDAVHLARARHKMPISEETRARLGEVLASQFTSLVDTSQNAYALGLSRTEWGERTLAHVLDPGFGRFTNEVVDALVVAPWPDLLKFLDSFSMDDINEWHGRRLYEVLHRRDSDPAAELLALAERYRADATTHLVTHLLAGILPQLAKAGLELPPAWDEDIAASLRELDVHRAHQLSRALAAAAAAGKAFSDERCAGMIQLAKDGAEGQEAHWAHVLLRHGWNEALAEQALSELENNPHLNASEYHDETESLGLIGPRVLPLLERAFDAATQEGAPAGRARAIWGTILTVAAVAAEEGALDARLEDIICEPGFQMTYLGRFRGKGTQWGWLLSALPPERARALADRLTAGTPDFADCLPEGVL